MQIDSTKSKPVSEKLIYCLLFMLFSFWTSALLGYGICYVSQFLLAFIIFTRIHAKINKRVLRIVATLFVMHVMAIFFGSYYLNLDLGNIITLVVSLIIVSSIPFEIFARYYTKFMYFICIYSLIIFLLSLIIPSIFSVLPTIDATVKVYNVLFAFVPVESMNSFRNFGMWGEPGMFGVYIVFATLLELFYLKPINKKHIFVIIITLITTFSTAAYISFIVLFGVFILSSNSIPRASRFVVLLFTILLSLFFVYYLINSSGNQAYVFLKLTETDSNEGTTFERIRAIKTAMMLIGDYFPTGAGWGVYSKYLLKQETILTATPLNWFAVYGLIYGLIMNIGILIGSARLGKSGFQKVGIAVGLLCAILSQEVSSVYISVIPILYAYSRTLINNKSYAV